MAEMSSTAPAAQTYTRRAVVAPLRSFLHTESGSAGVLVARHRRPRSCGRTSTPPRTSRSGTTRPLAPARRRPGVDPGPARRGSNSGLMTLFFLVVGLEARREFDLGDLRERRRFVLPFAAGLGRHGRARRSSILAVNAGRRARTRLGRRDVDRHRARPRPARHARPRRAGPGPGLPAHHVRGRRPGRAGRHRGRLQRPTSTLLPLLLAVAVFGRCSLLARRCGCGSAGCTLLARRRASGRRCWPAASTRSSPGWRSG